MSTLFDLIYDFFYIHVFGQEDYTFLSEYFFKCGYSYNYDTNQYDVFYMPFQDWLCTTATIISITIIVVLCCLFVYKIIKLIGGLIR